MSTGTGPLKSGTKIEPPVRPAPAPQEAVTGASLPAHEPEAITGYPLSDTGVKAELDGKTLEVGQVEHVEIPKLKGKKATHPAANHEAPHGDGHANAEGEHGGEHAPAWTHNTKIPMEIKHGSHLIHATKEAQAHIKKHGAKSLLIAETHEAHGAHGTHGTGDRAVKLKALRGQIKDARTANHVVRTERQGVKAMTKEVQTNKLAENQARLRQKQAHGVHNSAQTHVKQAKTGVAAARHELESARKELAAAQAAGRPTGPLAERVAQASEHHIKATRSLNVATEQLVTSEHTLRLADQQAGVTRQAVKKSTQSLATAENKLHTARTTRTERVVKVKQGVKATGLKVVSKGVSLLGAAAGVGLMWSGIKHGNWGQMVQGASDIMTGLRDLSSKLGSNPLAAKLGGALAAVANLIALVQDFQKSGKWDTKRILETTQHAIGALGGIAMLFPGGQALGAALTAVSAGIGVGLFVADHWNDIKGWSQDTWKSTSKFVSGVGTGLSDAWSSVWGSRPPPRPAHAH